MEYQDNLIIEHDDFLTEDETDFINRELLSARVPWFYGEESTTKKFPYFCHEIITRTDTIDGPVHPQEILSPTHDFFSHLTQRFCSLHDLEFHEICRQALNLTFANDDYEYGDIHIDHPYKHYNFIIYLNDEYDGGETLLFDKKFELGKPSMFDIEKDSPNMNILHEITPKKGKALCFDGHFYHTMRWIRRGRRVIYVGTFR